MDFETPREAVLRAENARLKAEVEYLRRAVDPAGCLEFTPVAAREEMIVQRLEPVLQLPMVGMVHGALGRGNTYHVLARLSHARAHAEDLVVQYHAPADTIKGKADYFVNELFPYLHLRFISALANAINKPRQEVA